MQALPITIRDISPGPDAQRLTGTHGQNGLPSGFHTGGAWLLDGEVWKPLDGRPWANSENHYPTQEAECLEAMAGELLFPRNWRVEERNGRRFVVRKKAHLIPEDVDYRHLTNEQILLVEQGIRNLNQHRWEIGDSIALAIDPDSYELFLYDLSTAHKMNGVGCYAANEEWRILQFFEVAGATLIKLLREKGRDCNGRLIEMMTHRHAGYIHTYASFNRPISGIWASIPDARYIHEDRANWAEAVPHTWVLTQETLDEDVLSRYELRWAYSPLRWHSKGESDGRTIGGHGKAIQSG